MSTGEVYQAKSLEEIKTLMAGQGVPNEEIEVTAPGIWLALEKFKENTPEIPKEKLKDKDKY